jgi:hypothetical protein
MLYYRSKSRLFLLSYGASRIMLFVFEVRPTAKFRLFTGNFKFFIKCEIGVSVYVFPVICHDLAT